MESHLKKRDCSRKRRKLRVRKTLKGTKDKPRLSVFKSLSHIYVQLINDEDSKTIFGIGTYSKEIKNSEFGKKSKAAAHHLGQELAKKAKELGISKAIFDRGIYKYHGIIAEIAEGARSEGLQF